MHAQTTATSTAKRASKRSSALRASASYAYVSGRNAGTARSHRRHELNRLELSLCEGAHEEAERAAQHGVRYCEHDYEPHRAGYLETVEPDCEHRTTGIRIG
jgi:hypothetical protein